jgi:hypothetical protein
MARLVIAGKRVRLRASGHAVVRSAPRPRRARESQPGPMRSVSWALLSCRSRSYPARHPRNGTTRTATALRRNGARSVGGEERAGKHCPCTRRAPRTGVIATDRERCREPFEGSRLSLGGRSARHATVRGADRTLAAPIHGVSAETGPVARRPCARAPRPCAPAALAPTATASSRPQVFPAPRSQSFEACAFLAESCCLRSGTYKYRHFR